MKKLTYIALISIVVVAILPFLETHTVTGGGPFTVLYGFPFRFLHQHVPLTPMEQHQPLHLGFMDPRESPTQILWGSWLLNVGIVAAVILSVIEGRKQFAKRKYMAHMAG